MPDHNLLRAFATDIHPTPSRTLETPGFYRGTVSAVNGALTTVAKPGTSGATDDEIVAERLCAVNVGDVVRVYRQAGLRVIVGVETGPGIASRWQNLSPVGAWLPANTDPQQWMVDNQGFVHLRGAYQMSTAMVAGQSYPITEIPIPPTQQVNLVTSTGTFNANVQNAHMSIDTSGTVIYVTSEVASGATAYLDSVPPYSAID